MNTAKISLIFMFDEGETRRLRLNVYWLWVFAVVMVFVPLLFILSVWLNFYFFEERQGIIAENIELQRSVNENIQTIARLENLEMFLRNHAVTDLVKKIPTKVAVKKEVVKIAKPQTPARQRSDVTISVDSVVNGDGKINNGYVHLEKLEATLQGKNLDVRFNLMNTGKVRPLLGRQRYKIIVSNGKLEKSFPVTQATDMGFRINSWKRVVSTAKASFPEDYITDLRLEVSVVHEGKVVYRDIYPIKQIPVIEIPVI